jgi:hypothetical protein
MAAAAADSPLVKAAEALAAQRNSRKETESEK